jgi:Cyclin
MISDFMKHFEISIEIVVAALIYTERIIKLNSEWLELNERNDKALLHTALSIASKFYLDKFERKTNFHSMLG